MMVPLRRSSQARRTDSCDGRRDLGAERSQSAPPWWGPFRTGFWTLGKLAKPGNQPPAVTSTRPTGARTPAQPQGAGAIARGGWTTWPSPPFTAPALLAPRMALQRDGGALVAVQGVPPGPRTASTATRRAPS